ncbi:MAG: AAA-associated domain-containing protein [Candidatus Thermoplasmatota archaeon]|nr:AAA-associated domain-containing protein [Candidatus Thermoplasmatota archaeon]MCL6014441.1 AAA-associated domain-containing protein [Candidatus Thermoplasmatota archaeon]
METVDPDARIADLVGLLHVLNHLFDDRTDLFELEKEMEVDIDDLMPIVYTAANLGFVGTDQGDIWITDKGKTFLVSGPKIRKSILKASLITMEPFVTALRLVKFDLDDIMEELEKNGIQKYNNPSGLHNLEITLIEWGVYSGLIKKDDDGFQALA